MTVLTTLRDRLNGFTEAIASRLHEAMTRRRMVEEFAGLGDRDLDRVLADIGCTRDELSSLVDNAPRSKPLLDAMILRLGLEKHFALAGPPLTRDIERRCATCPTQSICSRWLTRGGAPGEYRLFCPNAGNFEIMTGKAAA